LKIFFYSVKTNLSFPGSIGRKCPDGWEKFGSQCFKYFSESKSWAEAEVNLCFLKCTWLSASYTF